MSRIHDPAHDADGEIARDARALVSETSRDLPAVHETVRRAQERAIDRARSPRMAAIRFFGDRPVLSTAFAVALGLFVVFGLPIPYEKTVGHDVALTLAGAGVDAARAAGVAREMGTLLGAESVRVEAEAGGDAGTTYRLVASVPERSGTAARRAADAFAGTLTAAGIDARAAVTPRTEHVSGTMYAFAADRIVRVAMDGKSASQIEAEIRSGLAAAGFGDAEVSVTDEADGRRVKVELQQEGGGEVDLEASVPQLVLTEGGEVCCSDGQGCSVQVRHVKGDDAGDRVIVDVTKNGRTATAEIANAAGMSDFDLRAALQAELDRAGVDVRVDVVGGEIRVQAD